MNIVYLLGNGFDLNFNLATTYRDFYTFYKNTKSYSNVGIKKLKEKITGDISKWSDLEIALGEYSIEFDSVDDFVRVLDDVMDKLIVYLKEQEDGFDSMPINGEDFFEFLLYPEKSLTPKQNQELSVFKDNWSNNHWFVNVITFNYTKCFEKITGLDQQRTVLGTRGNVQNLFNGINHIHGTLEDGQSVLGVNDISQIHNKAFHESDVLKSAFVKSVCNQVMEHEVDSICTQQIQEANLICLFGSSIGDTDKVWWELIARQLVDNNSRLIIFEKRKQEKRKHKYGQMRIDVRNSFLSKTNLTKEEKEEAFKRIFVEINSPMLSGLME